MGREKLGRKRSFIVGVGCSVGCSSSCLRIESYEGDGEVENLGWGRFTDCRV